MQLETKVHTDVCIEEWETQLLFECDTSCSSLTAWSEERFARKVNAFHMLCA